MRPIDAYRLKAVLEKNFGHTGEASVLEQLIDEQPTIEPSTNCSEIPNSSDTISRQAAIDALDCISGVEEVLRSLPTVPPEPSIPLSWVEKYIEWLKGFDNEFANLAAAHISVMVKKWRCEQHETD